MLLSLQKSITLNMLTFNNFPLLLMVAQAAIKESK